MICTQLAYTGKGGYGKVLLVRVRGSENDILHDQKSMFKPKGTMYAMKITRKRDVRNYEHVSPPLYHSHLPYSLTSCLAASWAGTNSRLQARGTKSSCTATMESFHLWTCRRFRRLSQSLPLARTLAVWFSGHTSGCEERSPPSSGRSLLLLQHRTSAAVHSLTWDHTSRRKTGKPAHEQRRLSDACGLWLLRERRRQIQVVVPRDAGLAFSGSCSRRYRRLHGQVP